MNGNGNSHRTYLPRGSRERFAAGAMACPRSIYRKAVVSEPGAHARVGEWSGTAEARLNYACTASGAELELHISRFTTNVGRGCIYVHWRRDGTGTRRINAGVCAATSLLGFQSWTASARRRRVSPGLRLAQRPAVSAPRRVSAVISLIGFPSCDCACAAETCLSPGQPSGAVPSRLGYPNCMRLCARRRGVCIKSLTRRVSPTRRCPPSATASRLPGSCSTGRL